MNKQFNNSKIEIKKKLHSISSKIEEFEKIIDLKAKKKKIKKIETLIQEKKNWTSQNFITKINKEYYLLKKEINRFEKIKNIYFDAMDFLKILINLKEILEIKSFLKMINNLINEIEIEKILNKKNDSKNAILNINSGQGGIDSQDFVRILLRMYKKYADRNRFKTKIIDIQSSEEGGIKNVTILISGKFAYGYLKSEIGVHRLIRVSPFRSSAKRHTSFASIWIVPEVNNKIKINIKSDDLKIDTFKSSGAGGQHVNKTDSAVRITHIPSKTTVSCQSERSQVKNKENAIKMLQMKLQKIEMQKKINKKKINEKKKKEASFGSQIRNYILSQHKVIKDLRTGIESLDIESVLNGNIEKFIKAYLLKK